MSRFRKYDGGDPLAPPVDLAEALDAIGQDVMAGYSPERAMREFLRRGGTVVDGTGGDAFVADIAIDGDRIVAVGENLGAGREEIDAAGKVVTPGFVDVHTHYDGQATWDAEMAPSSWHGVTTVVMGNCGVGFAPCRAADRPRGRQPRSGTTKVRRPGAARRAGAV